MCMTALVIMAASTAMSAYGAYQQSKAQQASLDYQAQVNANNATAARQNAQAIRDRAEVAEDEHRTKIARQKGTAIAVTASRGVLVDDVDSSIDFILQDAAQYGEYDIAKIHDDAALRARQAEIEGTNFDAKSALASFESSTINPTFNAASTLLSGASSMASAGADMGYTGITGGSKPVFG